MPRRLLATRLLILSTAVHSTDIGTRDRRAVPIAELWDLYGARDTD